MKLSIIALLLAAVLIPQEAYGEQCRIIKVTRPKSQLTAEKAKNCRRITTTITRSKATPTTASASARSAAIAATPAPSNEKLPHCQDVSAGTRCTTSGSGAVGDATAIKAECERFVGLCKAKGIQAGDCENKGRDCKAKVDRGDVNPAGPRITFGFSS